MDVLVNGKRAGTLWKPPYRIDITNAVRSVSNNLKIRVANLWPNCLIGDEELPPENEYSGADTAMGSFGALFAGKIARLPNWHLQGKPKPPGGRGAFTT